MIKSPYNELLKQITTLNDRLNELSDETAKYRRWLKDALYNLDDDNVPN